MAPAIPLNGWSAAARDHELRRPLRPRTLCGRRLVLFGGLAGVAVALPDACWHRLLPLSAGRLCGDEARCGQHGLRLDPRGRCTPMPSQETNDPAARLRSFPGVERHRFVRVWPGDPAPCKVPAEAARSPVVAD